MLKRFLPFIPVILLIACFPSTEIPPVISTAVIQTVTASIWTPTPSTTPEPQTGKLVDALNSALMGIDPLAETIGSKFKVIDVRVLMEPPNNISGILRIDIECEWVYSDSCTPEESFVRLMYAFRKNEKVRELLSQNVPITVHTLQMASFNDMHQEGMIVVLWKDVRDYMDEKINGNQLGARITRLNPIP